MRIYIVSKYVRISVEPCNYIFETASHSGQDWVFEVLKEQTEIWIAKLEKIENQAKSLK